MPPLSMAAEKEKEEITMQSKTLDTIQTLAKIGRVLSKIVFIFSLIGAIGCAAGILSVKFLPESIQLGRTTIQGFVDLGDDLNPNAAIFAMVPTALLCAGEAILAKIAERYFRREIADGTPFTFDGAKALQRLGVCAIVIPIAASVLAALAMTIMSEFVLGAIEPEIGEVGTIGLGVMMIVASLLCRHGAELSQGRD